MKAATVRNFVIGGFCLIVPVVWMVFEGQKDISADNCSRTNMASLVFVLDRTGSLSARTQDHIEAVIETKLEQADSHTRVSIFNIQEDGTNFEPAFQTCVPEKKTWSTGLTKNEKKVLDKWEAFRNEASTNIRFDGGESASSPVYRTITNIVRDRKTVVDPNQTELVIFSDFIEYSRDVFDLHSGCDSQNPGSSASVIRKNVTNDDRDRPLEGIVIHRHMIPRDGDRPRTYRTCVKQVSDMVFNGLGMGSSQSFQWTPGSPQD